MNRQEIKEEAKKRISGNKWNILWPALLFGFVIGLVETIFMPKINIDVNSIKSIKEIFDAVPTSYFIISIVTTLLTYVFTAGYVKYVLSFVRTGKFDTKTILETIKKRWLQILVANIVGGLIIALASILFVIPGIIMSLAYAFMVYVVVDSDKSGIESLKASRAMMKGYKGDYFVFILSFIGWILLVPFTLGILLIWLVPYIMVANTIYYEKLKAKK